MSDNITEIPLMEDVEEIATTDLEALFPDEDQRNSFIAFIRKEIDDIENGSERELLLEDLKTWRRQRLARPPQAQKNTPWERAANTCPPLAASSTNTLYGTFKRAYEKKKPFFQGVAATRGSQKAVDAAMKLVNALLESKFHIDFRTKNRRILYDAVSLGTSILAVPWRNDRRMVLKKSGEGTFESVPMTLYNAPDVVAVPRENFLIRSYYSDPQTAPFCAFKWTLTASELRSRAESGYYLNIEDVLERGREQDISDEQKEELERSVGTPDISGTLDLYAIYECYAFWQGPEGYITDFKIWYNYHSDTVVRVEPNQLGVREIGRIPFWDVPGLFDGIGVGWMSQYAQEEGETLHNMLLNSLSISSLQMYVTRRGAVAEEGMKFYPLKNIEVDGDPTTEFYPVKFPSIGTEVFQAEQLVRALNDRYIGSSDARMGFADTIAKSGASPSMMSQQLQQGNVILEAIGENLDDGYSQIGTLILMQLAANLDKVEADGQLASLVDENEWMLIRDLLSGGIETLPNKLKVTVITTPPEQTESAKRQALTVLVELYSMYSQQLYSDLQIATSPQLPDEIKAFAMQFIIGRTRIMEQVLKMYGEKDSEEYLPYIEHMNMLLEHLDAMKQQQVDSIGGINATGGAGMGQMGAPGAGQTSNRGSSGSGGMGNPEEGTGEAGGAGFVPTGVF